MNVIALDPKSIRVPENRQRKIFENIQDLTESIRARAGREPFYYGLIHPITITYENDEPVLVAGERRLRAHLSVESPLIFARVWDNLSFTEKEMLELEENTKRQDLHWTERAKTFQRLHHIKTQENSEWHAADTARFLGYSETAASEVNKALALEGKLNDKLAAAPTLEAAFAALQRAQTRQFQDLTNEILATPIQPKSKATGGSSAQNGNLPAGDSNSNPAPGKVEAIHNKSFLDWAPSYKGHKFNFIHCDFPYGINLQDSAQMDNNDKLYEDSPEIYDELLKCFCTNLDKFTYPSAHLMFWLSADLDTIVSTRNYLQQNTNFVIQPKVLIWHKSCGSGMVPDARRRPRNTYEVALMGSRGDRFILKPVNSSYAGPLQSKRLHPSEKPEPMLKHFFEMFVDENTSIFDPTAGSGSALRAADAMGAKRLLGLEYDAEFCATANGALANARALRTASNKIKST